MSNERVTTEYRSMLLQWRDKRDVIQSLVLDGSCDMGLANTAGLQLFNCNERMLNGVVNSAAPGPAGRTRIKGLLGGRPTINRGNHGNPSPIARQYVRRAQRAFVPPPPAASPMGRRSVYILANSITD